MENPIGDCPAVAQACTLRSLRIAIHPSGTAPSWSKNTDNRDNQEILTSESKPMWQHRYSPKGLPEWLLAVTVCQQPQCPIGVSLQQAVKRYRKRLYHFFHLVELLWFSSVLSIVNKHLLIEYMVYLQTKNLPSTFLIRNFSSIPNSAESHHIELKKPWLIIVINTNYRLSDSHLSSIPFFVSISGM